MQANHSEKRPSVRTETARPARYPVNIALTSDVDDGMYLVAVCNDGTVWRIPALDDYAEGYGWHQYPPVPQPEVQP